MVPFLVLVSCSMEETCTVTSVRDKGVPPTRRKQ
jgi:hypothetical protein